MLTVDTKDIKVTFFKSDESTWSWSAHISGDSGNGEGSRSTVWGKATSLDEAWDDVQNLLVIGLSVFDPEDDENFYSKDPVILSADQERLINILKSKPDSHLTEITSAMAMNRDYVEKELVDLINKRLVRFERKRRHKNYGKPTKYYSVSGSQFNVNG